jgi:hypothetical protein
MSDMPTVDVDDAVVQLEDGSLVNQIPEATGLPSGEVGIAPPKSETEDEVGVASGASLKLQSSGPGTSVFGATDARPNTSTAVMQRRRVARSSLDDFPTPPWATRALCERLGLSQRLGLSCWEPCANRGFMVRPLNEYFSSVIASDVKDYGFGYPVKDFLDRIDVVGTDWIITNPPFVLAQAFVEKSLQLTRFGVAILARTAFLEGKGRYAELFSRTPPSLVLQFSERVPMVAGRIDELASSATAYCWLVWQKGVRGTHLDWIPPCRKQLERDGDYSVKDDPIPNESLGPATEIQSAIYPTKENENG